MKDRASSVKVGAVDNNLTRGGHILHEQEYNTGHGVSAISDEIRGEIRRQPRQPEVQQEPVIYLLLESEVGKECGISGLPVPANPSSPAESWAAVLFAFGKKQFQGPPIWELPGRIWLLNSIPL